MEVIGLGILGQGRRHCQAPDTVTTDAPGHYPGMHPSPDGQNAVGTSATTGACVLHIPSGPGTKWRLMHPSCYGQDDQTQRTNPSRTSNVSRKTAVHAALPCRKETGGQPILISLSFLFPFTDLWLRQVTVGDLQTTM